MSHSSTTFSVIVTASVGIGSLAKVNRTSNVYVPMPSPADVALARSKMEKVQLKLLFATNTDEDEVELDPCSNANVHRLMPLDESSHWMAVMAQPKGSELVNVS